jgi:nucleoside phosphorylase
MENIKASDLKGKIDFGIITVIKEEFEAILDLFPSKGIILGARRDYVFSYLSHSENKSKFKIAIINCVNQGNKQSQKITEDLISDLAPKWIILCGIAGGIPTDDFSLGDVVIANRKSLDASVGADQFEKTTFDTHGIEMSQSVENLLGVLESLNIKNWTEKISCVLPKVEINDNYVKGSEGWRKKIKESLKKRFFANSILRKPLFIHGQHISSDQLRKNPDTIERFLDTHRKAYAFEMELAGVCKAAGYNYPVLAVRGISDVVGFERSEEWTRFACYSASAFTHTIIENFPYAPNLEEISLSAYSTEKRADKKSLLNETLERISSNIENPKYKKHIFPQDSKSFYNLLTEQESISVEVLEELIPLSSMCGGCGRGEENYITLREAFIFITSYLLEDFEDRDSRIKFLYRISSGERYLGNTLKSQELAQKVLSEKLNISDRLETYESILRTGAIHDTKDLEYSTRLISFREGLHGNKSQEYINAKKCLACTAIGMNHPDSEKYLSDYEESFRESQHHSKKAEWERSFQIMKTVLRFNSNKAELFSNKEKAVSALQNILDWATRTEFNISRPNKAFINWLLFKLTNESDYLITANNELISLGKRTHCLFDFENLRRQVDNDFRELKK